MQNEVQHLLELLQKVAEDSLYTAQAHFRDAKSAERKRWLLIAGPALLGALLALLAATCSEGTTWTAAAAAFLATIAGVASSIGVDRDAAAHNSAAQALTVLRHEASRLATGYWREMSSTQVYAEVRRICDKYDQLSSVLIPTSDEGFAKGQARIKQGTFDYDFKAERKSDDSKDVKTL